MPSKTPTLPAPSPDAALPADSPKTFIQTALLSATLAAAPDSAKPDTPPRAKRPRLEPLDESFTDISPPRSPPLSWTSSAKRPQGHAPADPTLGCELAGQCVLCPPPWNQNRFMDRGSQYEHVRRHMLCIVAADHLPQDAKLTTGQWMKLAFPVPLPVSVPVPPVPEILPTGSELQALLDSYASPPTSTPECVPPPPIYYHPESKEVAPPSAPPGYWTGRNYTYLPFPRTLPGYQPPQAVPAVEETVKVSQLTQTPLWWPARRNSESRKRDMPKDPDTIDRSGKKARPTPPPLLAASSSQPPVPHQVSVHVQAVSEPEKLSQQTQTPKRKPRPSTSTSTQCDMSKDTDGNPAKRARPSHPSTDARPSTSRQAPHQVEEKVASKPTKGAITAPKKVAHPMPNLTAKPTPTAKTTVTAKAIPTTKPTPTATAIAKTTRNSEPALKPKPLPSTQVETELKKTTKHMQKTTSKGGIYKCPIKTAGAVCGFEFGKGTGIRNIERHLAEKHVKRGFGVCLRCDKRHHSTAEKCCKAKVTDDRGSVKGELLKLLKDFCVKGAS